MVLGTIAKAVAKKALKKKLAKETAAKAAKKARSKRLGKIAAQEVRQTGGRGKKRITQMKGGKMRDYENVEMVGKNKTKTLERPKGKDYIKVDGHKTKHATVGGESYSARAARKKASKDQVGVAYRRNAAKDAKQHRKDLAKVIKPKTQPSSDPARAKRIERIARTQKKKRGELPARATVRRTKKDVAEAKASTLKRMKKEYAFDKSKGTTIKRPRIKASNAPKKKKTTAEKLAHLRKRQKMVDAGEAATLRHAGKKGGVMKQHEGVEKGAYLKKLKKEIGVSQNTKMTVREAERRAATKPRTKRVIADEIQRDPARGPVKKKSGAGSLAPRKKALKKMAETTLSSRAVRLKKGRSVKKDVAKASGLVAGGFAYKKAEIAIKKRRKKKAKKKAKKK